MIKYMDGIKLRRIANILEDKNKYFKVFYWLQQWAKSNKQIFNLNKENILHLKKSLYKWLDFSQYIEESGLITMQVKTKYVKVKATDIKVKSILISLKD